jgi:hypothetical protein
MNKSLAALTSLLTYGLSQRPEGEMSNDFVGTLALVYEKARNALEYRADNLVRRAAIERILKRRILLNKDPESLAQNLLLELKWAKYLSIEDIENTKKLGLTKILAKYISFIDGTVPTEWIVKIASAEIEEFFNLNTDYKQFTFFAFQNIRQRIQIREENLDLLTYFAVDKVYAGSDDEQIAYHILNLAGPNVTKKILEEAWKLFNKARGSKVLSRIMKFVRRQMPPLVLLRDVYFYKPADFKETVYNQEKFGQRAKEVLEIQIKQLSGRVTTAGIRSIIYVFLTKMVLAFGLEVPLEIFVFGRLGKLPLTVNLIFPPFLMWLATTQIKLPSEKEKEGLMARAWIILSNPEFIGSEKDVLKDSEDRQEQGLGWWIFSVLYGVCFVGVFVLIYYLLGIIGFTFFSKVIFIFFLCIIAFFAYRIVQITRVYSWKNAGRESTNFTDMISVPILAIGSRLSQGLSKLNFLAFAFDFILEAPFKLILGFLDDWVQFLSIKREEEIIE